MRATIKLSVIGLLLITATLVFANRILDVAVLSHSHVDHISGFDYMLQVKPAVKAYLPADPALGSPTRLTISHDSKESLVGVPPEQLYFGGQTNSMEYHPGARFHAPNAEFVGTSRELDAGL